MKSSELGLSAMYRILKKSGAQRVSDESAIELRRVIEEIAEAIAKNAVEDANHFFTKSSSALIKSLDKYIKKETTLF